MKFLAKINVMPLKALLDPQGKAVTHSLHNLGTKDIDNVRIGKHINMEVTAKDKKTAEKMVDQACKDLLHNPIMEQYSFELETIK